MARIWYKATVYTHSPYIYIYIYPQWVYVYMGSGYIYPLPHIYIYFLFFYRPSIKAKAVENWRGAGESKGSLDMVCGPSMVPKYMKTCHGPPFGLRPKLAGSRVRCLTPAQAPPFPALLSRCSPDGTHYTTLLLPIMVAPLQSRPRLEKPAVRSAPDGLVVHTSI